MDFLYNLKPYILVSYYFFISILIVIIILENKKPEKSFAYIFLILLVPVAGVLIYFLLGAQYQKKKLYTRKRYFNNVYLHNLNLSNKIQKKHLKIGSNSKLPTLFFNIEQVNFTEENSVQILINGEEKFPVLIDELNKAKNSIHIEYYIFNDDNIGSQIINILCKKSLEGVSVKMIYDDVGSSISNKNLKKLKIHNVEVYPYMPVLFSKLALKANYRNHRKIVIIDNEVGLLGGININDKYINLDNTDHYWRDTHILLKGNAVIDLQYIFISDWYFVSGNKIDLKNISYTNSNKINTKIATSILGSDYGSNNQNIMEAFFGMITNAREEILITTPYFLPNESILNALKITAKSGVKIKIIIPEKTDIRTAYFASQTYLKNLIESGIDVYYYTKGMIHAKTMIVDSYICTVGSANMDHRSFNYNAEVNAFFLNHEIAEKLKNQFNNDLINSYKLQIQELNNRKWYIKAISSIARLIAPVL